MSRRLVVLAAAALLASCQTTTPTPAPAPAPAVPANAQQLLDDVRILSADDMEGRDTGSPGGERARAYIVSRLEAMGIEAPPVGRLQPFEAEVPSRSGLVRYKGTNIIGLIPGTRATDRYIVVSAHYDHVGVANGLVYNGADDNASGVATMLELARRLKAQAPEHSVLIVAFDGEERGLIGAKHFVQAPPVPLSSIALNLNFDMTSRAETDGHLWVSGTYQNPTFRPILDAVAPSGAISLAFGHDTPQDTGSDNWTDASDHGPFFKAGLPFIYMGVVDHPDYHRPSDDFDKITPSAFISSTELAIAAFRALDRSLDR
ncbi:M20/M25/M40 family metallo-hydrolase [Brevundimonas goettingensis]|uniref:M20/M25/M40 family metallo-hydrolase n=1 Tax=Brevundimonas goettingensis TaxID=2774190 RepID=A0A975C2W6_9CAUL|nr:M20/M25/M40 family metallo-hydrolase [Brevundimonas goettingensis]QTC92084.1 M20/M25/M40 family metallo-hydrolase [Brevundimonas goettingensis]